MKILNYIAVPLCCLSLLAACNNEDGENNSPLAPLEVNVVSNPERSVIEGTVLPFQTSFGLFGVSSAEATQADTEINNLSVYYNGQCTLSETVLLDEQPCYLKAYYPYSEQVSNGVMDIDVHDQTDVLLGESVREGESAYANNEQPKVDIAFRHALTRLTFRVSRTHAYGDDFHLSAQLLYPLYTTAKVDVVTQRLMPENLDEATLPISVEVTRDPSVFDVIVIPMESGEPKRGMVLYDDNHQGQWIDLPTSEWKPGQQYTYEVIFDADHVIVSEAVITPWETTIIPESEITDNDLVND